MEEASEDEFSDDEDIEGNNRETEVKKHSRPDRAKKRQQQKTHDQTVVKAALGSLLKGDEACRLAIRSQIEQRVDVYSKRMVLLSLNMNKLLKELFNGQQLENVSLPEFDITMVRQLMVGLEGCSKVHPLVEAYFERNPQMLTKVEELPRHPYDRNIYSFGATHYLTNFKNYYWMNLSSWIKKFIYSTTVKNLVAEMQKNDKTLDPKAVFRYLLYDLHSWKMDAPMKKIKAKLPQWIREQLVLQHNILGTKNINKHWLKSAKINKPSMIRYCVFINRFLANEAPKINTKTNHVIPAKKLPLAPVCTIKSHYITIDTMSIYSILKGAKQIPDDLRMPDFETLIMEHWGSVVDYKKLQGAGRTFTGTIDTDGTSICVHFLKPKCESSIKDPSEYVKPTDFTGLNVIANDPGRNFIFYMAREKADGTFEVFKLSRRQYYNESGVFDARESTNKWMKNVKEAQVALTTVSSKGDSLEDFEAYLTVVFNHWNSLWTEMTHKKWASQRLRLYGGKKRCFANFFNRLEVKGKKTIIAYGAAKFAPGGKGEMSVPTTRAFKECLTRFETPLECEFRSTVISSKDKKTMLQSVVSKKTGKKVRGLLWCYSTNDKECKFINRDLNAAINILHCFVLPERPPMLCRGNPALPEMKVGIKIIC